MAQNICSILLKQEEAKEKELDLGKIPIGDLFRSTAFTSEDYELFSNINYQTKDCDIEMKNTFYSSEYMKKVGE